MRLALLFWCYKDVHVCVDRVKLLRFHNPNTPIYVLYGGDVTLDIKFKEALEPYIDDFWSYDKNDSPTWKWLNGDRVIARWYLKRGKLLKGWDRLFIAQWDMLIATSVNNLLTDMPDDSAIFSGRLPYEEVKDWWVWVRGARNLVRLYLFRARLYLLERYFGSIYTAPFIVVCAPRSYFERLSQTSFATMGFIEYRCPTLAEAWGYKNWSHEQLDTWRPSDPKTLNIAENRKIISADKAPVRSGLIRSELAKNDGFRIFHPVHGTDIENDLGSLPFEL